MTILSSSEIYDAKRHVNSISWQQLEESSVQYGGVGLVPDEGRKFSLFVFALKASDISFMFNLKSFFF